MKEQDTRYRHEDRALVEKQYEAQIRLRARLSSAYRRGRGVRLSHDDLAELVRAGIVHPEETLRSIRANPTGPFEIIP